MITRQAGWGLFFKSACMGIETKKAANPSSAAFKFNLMNMVEAAGVEPASGNIRLAILRM
jgi:hypothetical protein